MNENEQNLSRNDSLQNGVIKTENLELAKEIFRQNSDNYPNPEDDKYKNKSNLKSVIEKEKDVDSGHFEGEEYILQNKDLYNSQKEIYPQSNLNDSNENEITDKDNSLEERNEDLIRSTDSSSSELGRLQSPNRDSLEADLDFDEFGERDDVTPLANDTVVRKAAGHTPFPTNVEDSTDTDQNPEENKTPTLEYSSSSPRPSQSRSRSRISAQKLPEISSENNENVDNFQTKDFTKNISKEGQQPPPVVPYSSQRLKDRTDLKRKLSVSFKSNQLETNFSADSLEFNQSSLNSDINYENDSKDNQNIDGLRAHGLIKEENRTYLDNNLQDNSVYNGQTDWDDNIVNEDSVKLPTGHNILQKNITNDPENKEDQESIGSDVNEVTPVNNKESEILAPEVKSITPETDTDRPEPIEFVIRRDPSKQGLSRYSSAAKKQSRSSLNQSAHSSNRTTPSSRKIYIESPTFTREEETEIRFVSSRLDEIEEINPLNDTYRELDMATIERQQGYGAVAGARLPTEKKVRYSDIESRYEDLGSNLPLDYRNSNMELINENAGFPGYHYDSDKRVNNPQTDPNHQQTGFTRNTPQTNEYDRVNKNTETNQNVNSNFQKNPNEFADYYIMMNNRSNNLEFYNRKEELGFGHSEADENIVRSDNEIQNWDNTNPDQKTTPKVRGLTLPTGPTYDPEDEEDLKRETYYQEDLRTRVQDGIRQASETQIPKIPNDEAQNYLLPPDSLDFENSNENQIQPETRNITPTFFQSNPDYQNKETDYAEYGVLHSPTKLNPQIQPRFYNPNFTQAEEYNDGNLDNQNYDADPDYLSEAPTDRSEAALKKPRGFIERDNTTMEAVRPKPPKYDYITHNKEDYGRKTERNYQQLLHIKHEEKERAESLFIQPKPKGKNKGQTNSKKKAKVNEDLDSQHSPQKFGGNYEEDEDDGLTAAERVWARRSSNLANKRTDNGANPKGSKKRSLMKYNSDSAINENLEAYQDPPNHHYPPHEQQLQVYEPAGEKKTFLTEMPTPVGDTRYSQQLVGPISPRIEQQTQPLSQQIITEDGQRISVDVNLRLISPPPAGLHQQSPYYYDREYGMFNPQPVRGRQYPIAHYDSDSGDYRQQGKYNEAQFETTDGYGSPRARYSADEALRSMNESRTDMNPYGKIPPISSHLPSSAPDSEQQGSYAKIFQEQRTKGSEKPWYKVYGLRDYRRMQKEVRLGTLGPDLDNEDLREKKEKVLRQTDYAKSVHQKNKQVMSVKKPPVFPRPKETEADILSKRKLAMEYAKSVPKPTVRPRANEFNNYEMASEKSPIAKSWKRGNREGQTGQNGQPTKPPATNLKKDEIETVDLDKLRQRYEEDKQNEAIIRRNTGSSAVSKGYYGQEE